MTILVLSDVDGTILRGSLVLDHATYLHDKGVLDLGELPKKWAQDVKNETVMRDLAEAYRDAIIGKTLDDILVDDFLNEYLEKDGVFYEDVVEKLNAVKGKRTSIVLISGSPDYLITPFQKKMGYDDSFASHYLRDANDKFTGGVMGMFHSHAKRAVISRLDIRGVHHIVAFGDTASDFPLLEVANEKYLVNPHKGTMELAPAGTTII